MLTQDELKKWLLYNPESGEFTWIKGYRKGKSGGGSNGFGMQIRIFGKKYSARHIAWLYMTGEFPPDNQNVYSISQDPFSVKWSDLSITPAGCRDIGKVNARKIITYRERSMFKNNSLGIKGVAIHKPTGLYRAYAHISGKQYSFGYYKTVSEAEIAAISGRENCRDDKKRAVVTML